MKRLYLFSIFLLAISTVFVSCKDEEDPQFNRLKVAGVQIVDYEDSDLSLIKKELSEVGEAGFQIHEQDAEGKFVETSVWRQDGSAWAADKELASNEGTSIFAVYPVLSMSNEKVVFKSGVNNMTSGKTKIVRKGGTAPIKVMLAHKMCLVGYKILMSDGSQLSDELLSKVDVSLSRLSDVTYDIISDQPVSYGKLFDAGLDKGLNYIIPNDKIEYIFTTKFTDAMGRMHKKTMTVEPGFMVPNKKYTVELSIDEFNDSAIEIIGIDVEEWNEVLVEGDFKEKEHPVLDNPKEYFLPCLAALGKEYKAAGVKEYEEAMGHTPDLTYEGFWTFKTGKKLFTMTGYMNGWEGTVNEVVLKSKKAEYIKSKQVRAWVKKLGYVYNYKRTDGDDVFNHKDDGTWLLLHYTPYSGTDYPGVHFSVEKYEDQ